MRISAASHFRRTRILCDRGTLLAVLGLAAVSLVLLWDGVAGAPWATKVLLAFLVLVVAVWPRMFVSRLLCEILRECTAAQCVRCGGATSFVPSEDGIGSTQPVQYRCRQCGNMELLPVRYCDEVPLGPGSGLGDGLGGGGGL